MYHQRQACEGSLVRNKSRTSTDEHHHIVCACPLSQRHYLGPDGHLYIRGAQGDVIPPHIALDVCHSLWMSMELQEAIQLLSDTADMLQPLVEASLVLGLLRNGDYHSVQGSWRHDESYGHYLTVGSLEHMVDNRAKT